MTANDLGAPWNDAAAAGWPGYGPDPVQMRRAALNLQQPGTMPGHTGPADPSRRPVPWLAQILRAVRDQVIPQMLETLDDRPRGDVGGLAPFPPGVERQEPGPWVPPERWALPMPASQRYETAALPATEAPRVRTTGAPFSSSPAPQAQPQLPPWVLEERRAAAIRIAREPLFRSWTDFTVPAIRAMPDSPQRDEAYARHAIAIVERGGIEYLNDTLAGFAAIGQVINPLPPGTRRSVAMVGLTSGGQWPVR